MVLVEAGRTVCTPGSIDVITVCIAVIHTSQHGFYGIVAGIGCISCCSDGRTEFIDTLHYSALATHRIVVVVAVVFVSGKQIEGVFPELSFVSQQLIYGVTEGSRIGFIDISALVCSIAVVFVTDSGSGIIREVKTDIDRQVQSVEQSILAHSSQIEKSSCRCRIPLVISLVVEKFGLGVEALGSNTVGIAVVRF